MAQNNRAPDTNPSNITEIRRFDFYKNLFVVGGGATALVSVIATIIIGLLLNIPYDLIRGSTVMSPQAGKVLSTGWYIVFVGLTLWFAYVFYMAGLRRTNIGFASIPTLLGRRIAESTYPNQYRTSYDPNTREAAYGTEYNHRCFDEGFNWVFPVIMDIIEEDVRTRPLVERMSASALSRLRKDAEEEIKNQFSESAFERLKQNIQEEINEGIRSGEIVIVALIRPKGNKPPTLAFIHLYATVRVFDPYKRQDVDEPFDMLENGIERTVRLSVKDRDPFTLPQYQNEIGNHLNGRGPDVQPDDNSDKPANVGANLLATGRSWGIEFPQMYVTQVRLAGDVEKAGTQYQVERAQRTAELYQADTFGMTVDRYRKKLPDLTDEQHADVSLVDREKPGASRISVSSSDRIGRAAATLGALTRNAKQGNDANNSGDGSQ